MEFLKVEKKSDTYLRIIQSYESNGKSKHMTLHSLGKAEDYSINQLENIKTIAGGKILFKFEPA